MTALEKSVRTVGRLILPALLLLFMHDVPAFAASFDHYVKKYDNVEISRQGLENLNTYQELIEYFCDFAFFKPRHKVNPDFIRALILAESAADPKAVSHKNARGLGQILPETGKIAARELYNRQTDFQYVPRSRLKNFDPADLHDPAVNILLTCYLISKYNYQYDGRLQLVVSAWNAGVNAINDNNPPDYKETLDLIGRVNGYFKYLLNREKTIAPLPAPDRQRLTKN
ncbi:MAG: transglycosylase SLT domain-containing protein [Desulfobulbaceae bacterium]|nr:transglycosylase SLT domain-containing protein [Desulfobulbaceae bacterium]